MWPGDDDLRTHLSLKALRSVRAVILPHREQQRIDHLAFGRSDIRVRMSKIEDGAKRVALVPGLMLDRVVENERVTGLPDPRPLATRKPHLGGTISGTCTMSRALVAPVCGGMRVLGSSVEKNAVGA